MTPEPPRPTCHSCKWISWVGYFVLFCFALLLSSRTLCTSYHPRGEFQTLLPVTSWYWSHQGKHNAVKHWMEQRVTYLDKRARSASIVGVGPPWPGGPSPQLNQGNLPLHTLLLLQWKNPVPPLVGQQWGWPGVIWHTYLSRTKAHTLNLQQGKIFTWTGCMHCSSLGKQVFQAQDSFLYGQVGVKRLNDGTACPNSFVFGRGLGRQKKGLLWRETRTGKCQWTS